MDGLGMSCLTRMELRWGMERVEEKREGVKIGVDTMKAHAEEDRERGIGG